MRPILSNTIAALQAELRRRVAVQAETDFFTFFKFFAWPVLEPVTVYHDNWHVHAICEHLQAVTDGDVRRLLINMPFRMLKSTLVTQAWPAWEWIRFPHLQYLTSSYAKDLSTRDAVNTRRIIESPGYQEQWSSRFRMTSDQNVKTRYENSSRGSRVVTATDAAGTGFGGNRILVDDPLSAREADSAIERAKGVEWWKGTASTRFNNPENDAAVVVQQRLHEEDLSGYLLTSQPGVWEHLVLPMRYEPTRPVYVGGTIREVPTKDIKTSIGFVDPRTQEGELLCASRVGEATIREMESILGSYHTAAQMQQRPSTRGGTIFLRGNWKWYTDLPTLDEIILSVDCSFKDADTSDYVALQAWGRRGADKYLLKRVRERLGYGATVQAVRTMKALYPTANAVLIEDKANGSAVIETLRSEISGIIAINPEGGKVSRAYACQGQHEAGNFHLPDPSIDATIEQFVGETASFPNVSHDDETDAFTQAVIYLKTRERDLGLLNYYSELYADQKAAREEAVHGG